MNNLWRFHFCYKDAHYFVIKPGPFERGRALQPDSRNLRQVFRDNGQDEICDFHITVSDPRGLLQWLQQDPENNSLDHMRALSLAITATTVESVPPPSTISPSVGYTTLDDWVRLLEYINPRMTGLETLRVTWEHNKKRIRYPTGLGKSLAFVRALAKLRPSSNLFLDGYYAVNWPDYLKNEMQVEVATESDYSDNPIDPDGLRKFQTGTEGLWP